MSIYADHAATTAMSEAAIEATTRCMREEYGNPSSLYRIGQRAKETLEKAREEIAAVIGAQAREIFFTSGGSEADNQAIRSAALAGKKKGKNHIISTAFEHHAVLHTLEQLKTEGFEVTLLDVHENGVVLPEEVEAAIRPDTCLVTVMYANNEIGTIQPIREIGAICRDKNVLFHVDAVQGFGKARIYPAKMGIDLLAVSAHKIHGPKGMGFLYKAQNVRLVNLIYGGGQQNGMRSGTENVAGIAGMAMAADMIYKNFDEEIARMRGLKNLFLSELARMDGQQGENALFVNGRTGEDSAPHIISLTVPGVRAEVLLHALEDKGVYVSSGSACSTNRPHPSQTLQAIGLPRPYWDNTIRLSLSALNTEEDIRDTIAALGELVPFLRRYTRH